MDRPRLSHPSYGQLQVIRGNLDTMWYRDEDDEFFRMLDLPRNEKRFYDPSTFGAGTSEPPQDSGPAGRGAAPCLNCSHLLASHPAREGCTDCSCVWFREFRPSRPDAVASPPPLNVTDVMAGTRLTSPSAATPKPSSRRRILGTECPRCGIAMAIGQSLRYDDDHAGFAHSECLVRNRDREGLGTQ